MVHLSKSGHKLSKLFIIITVIFLMTWTPTFGRFLIRQCIFDAKTFRKFELSTMFLGLVDSTVNPVSNLVSLSKISPRSCQTAN